MNFTYKNYLILLNEILKNKKIIFPSELSENVNACCIKHDVECNIDLAYNIAIIENSCGIQATYYFQANLLQKIEDIKKFIKLGHRIGYHYDVLDNNNGDYKLAFQEFNKNIEFLISHEVHIEDICPHGNPLKIRNGWRSNKDFFRNTDIKNKFKNLFDIVVDIENQDLLYISDVGYNFTIIDKISTNDHIIHQNKIFKNDKEFFKIISSFNNIIISTHPHRWSSSNLIYICKSKLFFNLKKIVLVCSKNKILKKMIGNLSKYSKYF